MSDDKEPVFVEHDEDYVEPEPDYSKGGLNPNASTGKEPK